MEVTPKPQDCPRFSRGNSGVLRLPFRPLRLARDCEVGQQDGVNDDLTVSRTGELIHYQGDALPHRFAQPRPAPNPNG